MVNWWDWTLPGYKYLGPGNRLNKGRPTSGADFDAYKHDIGYDVLGKRTSRYAPYYKYNRYDKKLLEDLKRRKWSVGERIATKVFRTKKQLAQLGILPTDPTNVDEEVQRQIVQKDPEPPAQVPLSPSMPGDKRKRSKLDDW